ncbi:HNH endonuclease [Patescibacteria group bacterium]|nr:HNH endonuclease [Patescibacteria group bacterium]
MEDISKLLINAKKWGVPEGVLRQIVVRDRVCVYCSRKMKLHLTSAGTPGDKKTIEHFANDVMFEDEQKVEDVGICCGSCNSSKGGKKLSEWLKSSYCIERKINKSTVAQPVKEFIKKYPKK